MYWLFFSKNFLSCVYCMPKALSLKDMIEKNIWRYNVVQQSLDISWNLKLELELRGIIKGQPLLLLYYFKKITLKTCIE